MSTKRSTIIVNDASSPTPKDSFIKAFSKQSKRSLSKIPKIFWQVLLIVIIAAIPSAYFYHKSQATEHKLNGSTSTNLQTTSQVVQRVSRHILLPSGEQPTLATVTNVDKLRSQSFFANAANGDKILVYAQAKEAYLYRPSIDRIIQVAPLATGTGSGTTQ